MRGLKGIVLSVVGMWLTIGITACDGAAHKDFNTHSLSSASVGGEQAFKSTLYAFTQTQNCKMCHAALVSPFFASADLNVAYGFATQLVDFSNPTESAFVKYAGNSHCGASPCSDPANSEVVKNLLIQWAQAEGSSIGGIVGPSYLTSTIAVPANLPSITAARPAVMRFPLSALSKPVASLNKAILEIEIQKANLTNYRVNRIKIAGNTAAVRIKGVHVYVKPAGSAGLGVEDENQGNLWNDLDATAPVFALPATLPTTPLTATPLSTEALGIQIQSGADAITIGIEEIQ
jgi:hypothetical protein